MSIKDMPYVTVEQVLALRAKSIELEGDGLKMEAKYRAEAMKVEQLEAQVAALEEDSASIRDLHLEIDRQAVEIAGLKKRIADAVAIAEAEPKDKAILEALIQGKGDE